VPALILADRKIIRVDGADAGHFLQNLITANIDAVEPGEARPAALLTPQGKILFDFLISKAGETGYHCDVRADIADDFVRRMTIYKLRAAVSIEKLDDIKVIAGWNEAPPTGALADKRFPGEAQVWRLHGGDAVADANRAAWDALRISHGVAESGADFALSDIFPHDAMMDKNGGVDFRKGCYVGQEVVSRMQHRGTARRRVAIVGSETELPQTGPDDAAIAILAGEKPVGSLGTVVGKTGLAMVRTDRVAEALAQNIPLTAGGSPVSLALPGWTGLSFDAAPDS